MKTKFILQYLKRMVGTFSILQLDILYQFADRKLCQYAGWKFWIPASVLNFGYVNWFFHAWNGMKLEIEV